VSLPVNPSDPTLLAEVLHHALDGIGVVEGTEPLRLTYANATLAALLHRPVEWLDGRALAEVEDEAPADPNATAIGVGTRVRLRRADGTSLECERWAILLADARIALYYRPLQRLASAAPSPAADRAGGLSTPEHLMEVLRRDWSIAQRDGRTLTLIRIDVDACREYLEVYGRGATENVLRQVGRTIAAAMRRASDVVARVSEDEFAVLGVAMDPARALEHAEHVVGRVRALAILHPRSRSGRYLTVSAGVVTAVPPRTREATALLEAARRALVAAKAAGGNRVAGVELADPS
jgi:diguanylate cyclase (GGDEF)-like protein